MKKLNIGVARRRISQIKEYIADIEHELEIADNSNNRDDQSFRMFIRDTLDGIGDEADKARDVLNRRMKRYVPR